MTTFVLVHGAWHGAWCWQPLVDSLGRVGAVSEAPDLPGHGDDQTPIDQLTLADYADAVAAVLRSADEPVVLVGHSLGGLVISEAAERVPEKVSTLVYLCALMLSDGESPFDVMGSDPEAELLTSVVPSSDGLAITVDPAAVAGLFYADCQPPVQAWATARLAAEPIGPPMTPVHVTATRWGSLPRSYIVCTQDRAISPDQQQAMIDRTGVDSVVRIDASHSPFLSKPDDLASALIDIANRGSGM